MIIRSANPALNIHEDYMSVIVINPYRVAPPPASYLLAEDFGAGGFQKNWTTTTPGTVDPSFSTSPLDGSHSLRIANVAQPGRTYTDDFTAQADLHTYFLARFESAIPPSGKHFLELLSSSGTVLASLERNASNLLTMRIANGSANNTVATLAADTLYHFWFRYTKGTGANAFAEVGFSTTGTKPTSGNNYRSASNGAATADAARFQIGSSGNATWEAIFDKVRLHNAVIGDNPS